MFRVTFGDSLAQQAFRLAIGFRYFRSVGFVLDGNVFPISQNELSGFAAEVESELQNFMNRWLSHGSSLSQPVGQFAGIGGAAAPNLGANQLQWRRTDFTA